MATRLAAWAAVLAVTIPVCPSAHVQAARRDAGVSAAAQAAATSAPSRSPASGSPAAPPAAQPPASPQQAPPPSGQPGTQATPDPQVPGQQKPVTTFKMQIEMVTQDVIPRDSKGQFVADLRREDFEVFEDGVKQDVTSMVKVQGGRHETLIAAPSAPVATEGILVPQARQVVDVSGRIFVFLIDDLHVEFQNTGRLRELLTKMQKQLIHDGDMFAIQTTGPSSVAVDLTYDKKRFSESINKIQGSELKPSEIINGPEGAEGPNEVLYRAHVAFSTVNDLLVTLDQVRNRRKALIYISDGYDFNPFPDSRLGEDPNGIYEGRTGQSRSDEYNDPWNTDRQQQKFADADLVREIADLTRTANRANVTMYTIDPRGLVGGMVDMAENVDPNEWQDYLHKSQDSLRVLAEQTGGIAVINQNDYTKALQRIDAETSDYYVLGYYSKNPDPTKRWRSIEVKVLRPGVSVMARKGYQLKRPPRATASSK